MGTNLLSIADAGVPQAPRIRYGSCRHLRMGPEPTAHRSATRARNDERGASESLEISRADDCPIRECLWTMWSAR